MQQPCQKSQMLLAEDEWHGHLTIACRNSFQLLDHDISTCVRPLKHTYCNGEAVMPSTQKRKSDLNSYTPTLRMTRGSACIVAKT